MELTDRQLKNFKNKFVKNLETDCLEWIGCKDKLGYGVLSLNNKSYLAHRVAYLSFKGEIPEGLVLDHLCRNASCLNIDHLEAVTQKVNMERAHVVCGEKHSHAKLTQVQVDEIRNKYKTSQYTQSDLGKEYGIGQDQVSRILNMKRWK